MDACLSLAPHGPIPPHALLTSGLLVFVIAAACIQNAGAAVTMTATKTQLTTSPICFGPVSWNVS